MKVKKEIVITVLIVILLALSPSALSAVLTVCPSGCNSTTIQGAINLASIADIINASNGTYAENVIINKSITLKGIQAGIDAKNRIGDETIIDSNFTNGSMQIQAINVLIDGIKVINANIAFHVTSQSSNVVIKNVIISGAAADGINLLKATSATIENNLIKNIGLSAITSGDDKSTSNLSDDIVTRANIRNNKIINSKFGITGYQKNSIIEYNLIENYTGTDAAGIGGQFKDTKIAENEIRNYIQGAGISISSYPNRENSSGIDAQNNSLTNNLLGIFANQNLIGKNIHVNYNEILGSTYDAFNNGTGALDAENNYWGNCNGPLNITGDVDYIPWIGACVNAKEISPQCIFSNNNITLYANVTSSSCIGNVLFSININGAWQNYTGIFAGPDKYKYTIDEQSLDGGEVIEWTVYADDCFNHTSKDGNESFYVNQITNLSVTPLNPDGLNNWYATEPLFTLTNPNALSIFYEWDSAGFYTYTAPFSLSGIPNPGSAGILQLKWWSNTSCGLESKQNRIFKVDLTNPTIKDLQPPNNSIVYNNLRPDISAYLDEIYAENSGIDRSTVAVKLDGSDIPAHVYRANNIDATIEYRPPSPLSLGLHDVSVNATDNAGRNSEFTWYFTINLTGDLSMNATKPENRLYGTKKIPFEIAINQYVDKLEYIDYSDIKPGWKLLCKKCSEYGISRIKFKSFNDGNHTITIKALDYFGRINETNVSFSVDSKKPRIIRTTPRKNSAINGNLFYIKYTEENLKNITLNYGNNESISKDSCTSGTNQECAFNNINLSAYDSRWMEFWFDVSDYARNVSSDKIRVMVDTAKPAMNVSSPLSNMTYGKKVPFNITVGEDVQLKYFDNEESSPRWRILCSRCNSYSAEKSFANGYHEVTIQASDKAGNIGMKTINFDVIT